MRERRARVAWLAVLSGALTACAASTRPADDPRAYASAARALGADATADGCPLPRSELADRTIAAWRTQPESDPWAAEWACVAIVDDLSRDSMGSCTPAPNAVFQAPLSFVRHVTGEIYYVGLDPREYAYDIIGRPDGEEIEVRVQFTGSLAHDAALVLSMQRKMDLAADFRTRHAPEGRARFRFLAVTTDDTSPHFQVRLAPGEPRTPFDVTWGAEWSWHLLAHEIGHMMGLDDEYGQIAKTVGHALGEEPTWTKDPSDKVRWFHCDPRSLMCDSKGESSVPLAYHYYVLLRRRYCRVTSSERDVLAP